MNTLQEWKSEHVFQEHVRESYLSEVCTVAVTKKQKNQEVPILAIRGVHGGARVGATPYPAIISRGHHIEIDTIWIMMVRRKEKTKNRLFEGQ